MKKLTAMLLALAMAVSLAACTQKPEEQTASTTAAVTEAVTEPAADTTNFKLSYSKSDSLDPFKTETLNNQVLQTLVFEQLFVPDTAFAPQPMLATGYTFTDSETLEVTIGLGNTFSDGTPLTADSVIASFEKAKDSPHWGNALRGIASASKVSDTIIRFELSYPNPNALSLLTFAIAKDGTDDAGYPIGSGRYRFGEGDGNVYLEANDKKTDFHPHFTRIPLVNITSAESIENAINIGNISFAFRDMSTGSKAKIQSNKKAVALNNLVYIGINSQAGITKNENIRKAIALAVDRDTLVKSAYRGYAKSALSVFNPACQLGRQTVIFSANADVTAAKQAIAQSGIKAEDLTIDILTSTNEGKTAAAQLLKQQLEAVGFTVTINREMLQNFQSKAENSSFNIYIGETQLTADMSLRSFFTNGGATSMGIDLENSAAAASYLGYLSGDNEIGKFILDFSKEMPFIPLLYRQGMICYSKSLHGDMQGYTGNYFSNIEDWYYN